VASGWLEAYHGSEIDKMAKNGNSVDQVDRVETRIRRMIGTVGICGILVASLLLSGCAPHSVHEVPNYSRIYGEKIGELFPPGNHAVLILIQSISDSREIIHPPLYTTIGFWCSYEGQSKFGQPRNIARKLAQDLRRSTKENSSIRSACLPIDQRNFCNTNNKAVVFWLEIDVLEYLAGWVCGHTYTIKATVEMAFRLRDVNNEVLLDDIVTTELSKELCCGVTTEDHVCIAEKAKYETVLKLLQSSEFRDAVSAAQSLNTDQILSINYTGAFSEDEVLNHKRGHGEQQPSQGTGFLVSRAGYVVTNYHVGAGREDIKVVFPHINRTFDAEVQITDTSNDLVILKLKEFAYKEAFQGEIPYALRSSSGVKLGEQAFTLGFPLG